MNYDNKPALKRLLDLDAPFIKPDGCSDCPFATPTEEVNYADPDEAHYDCSLIFQNVWGESPKCEPKDWKLKAKEELETYAKEENT